MPDTDIQNRAPQPLSAILERVANPLLLFSGSLCFLLLLSWMFLLPAFTSVQRPDGVAMTPWDIAAYTKNLTADLADAEAHRITLVRAVNDVGYRALVDARAQTLSPLALEQELRLVAARLGEQEGVFVFSSITIKDDTVIVEGDVRNVQTRSLTVLAAFIDTIESLPFIHDLQKPTFVRETLPDGAVHSPFRFRFNLSPS